MKNILVTVGTTSFDALIKIVDSVAMSYPDIDFVFQIASGNYIPTNGECIKFSNSIDDLYVNADVIITHAGAGTIYKLLEMGKKILVVPNMERIDKHQSDIARYMGEHEYLLVAWSLDEVELAVHNIANFSPKPYVKTKFFKYKEIASYIVDLK